MNWGIWRQLSVAADDGEPVLAFKGPEACLIMQEGVGALSEDEGLHVEMVSTPLSGPCLLPLDLSGHTQESQVATYCSWQL